MGRLGPILIGVGAVLLAIFCGLGFGGLEIVVHAVIRNMIQLKQNTDIWRMWTEVPIPLYAKLRIFNITNPEGFAQGEKAKLVEMGPYVYLEDLQKVDITVNDEADTIRYRQTKTYYFQPQLSNGNEDDEVTFINVILISVATIAKEMSEDDFMLTALDDILTNKGERLTKTAKVRELIFDGVSVKPYIELLESDIVQAAAEANGLEIKKPEAIADGKFGIFKGKNGSDDGFFVVRTGKNDPKDIGRILTHKDQDVMTTWKGTPEDGCNRINGTDATIYPPFRSKEDRIEIFIAQICRSLFLSYLKDAQVDGTHVYDFTISPDNFAAPKTNPANWCFCPTVANETGTCEREGLFNVRSCLGAPLLISFPHFLNGDPSLVEAVEGLNPNQEQHGSVVHFHPLTGSPFGANVRIQFGIQLQPEDAMPTFAEVQPAVIPLAWLEEAAILDPGNAMKLKALDMFLSGFQVAKYGLIGFAALVLVAGAILTLVSKGRKKDPLA